MWKEGNMGTGMDIPEPKKNENEEVKSKKSEKKFLKKGVQKDNEPVGTQHPMPGVIEWKKEKKEYASLNERIIGNGATKLRELEVKYPSLVSSLEELNKPGISRQDFFAIVENFNSINMKEKSGSYDMIHITGEYGDITVKYYENGSASISASYPGSDSLEKPEKAEEKKEPEKSKESVDASNDVRALSDKEAMEDKKEKKDDLDAAFAEFIAKRKAYAEACKKFEQAKANKSEDSALLEFRLEQAEYAYKEIVPKYGQKLYQEKARFLTVMKGIERGSVEYKTAISEMKYEIFNNLIINSNDFICKEKCEGMEPKKRGWFRKMVDWLDTSSKKRNILLGGIIATGMIISPVTTTGLLGINGFFWLFDRALFKRDKKKINKKMDNMRKMFMDGMEGADKTSDWKKYIERFNKEYLDLVEEAKKLEKIYGAKKAKKVDAKSKTLKPYTPKK